MNLTLAWDAASDPAVAGYNIYYGVASRNYTNVLTAGNATSVGVSNLTSGVTYYFAATAYNAAGLESDYSGEITYTSALPGNQPPTLDPLPDMVINQDAGMQTVSLSGIGSGSPSENQTLTVTAFSSNPNLIPNPAVAYTSPQVTGTLTFAPVTGAFGSSTITVMVDDGGSVSNTLIRAFNVTVNESVPPSLLLTNITLVPLQSLRLALNPPYTNGDHFSFSLDATAPIGARIASRRGTNYLTWTPSSDQASTTNLILIHVSDSTTPSLSTNEAVQVIVLDYMDVVLTATTVRAGQNGSLPITINSSEGFTNLSFVLSWPTDRLATPALVNLSPPSLNGSVQTVGTNLIVRLQSSKGVAGGSNTVASLSFSTVPTQSSAFVKLDISDVIAAKAAGSGYQYTTSQPTRIVVVNQQPLLEATAPGAGRTLLAYAVPGTSYQVQSSTNLMSSGTWVPVSTYQQTNLVQSLLIGGSNPRIFYRLQQQ